MKRDSKVKSLFNDDGNKLKPVINLDDLSMQEIYVPQLFEGFESFKGITYSSSLNTLLELLKNFKSIEVIIAFEDQASAGAFLLDFLTKEAQSLNLSEGKEIAVFLSEITHAKLFLLEGPQSKRAIFGSANLSQKALLGTQNELILYTENPKLMELLTNFYETVKLQSKPVAPGKTGIKLKVEKKEEAVRQIYADISSFIVDSKGIEYLRRIEEQSEQQKSELNLKLEITKKVIKQSEFLKAVSITNKDSFTKEVSKILSSSGDEPVAVKLSYDGKEFYYYRKQVGLWDISKERIKKTVEAFNEYLSLSPSEDHKKSVGEALVFAFAGVYLPFARRKVENVSELADIPIVCMLSGIAKAGKTTVLESIEKMLYYNGGGIENASKITDSNSKDWDLKMNYYLNSSEKLPVLLDEVKTNILAEGKKFSNLIKNITNEAKTNCSVIFTTNLIDLSGERQVLRRVCFLPFEHQAKEKNKSIVKKCLNELSTDLFLEYLRALEGSLEEIYPNFNDPLYFARDFLRSYGLDVPDTYCGNYRTFMIRRWESIYIAKKDVFKEIDYPDKEKGKKIPCYVVSLKDLNYLTPLEEFEVATLSKSEVVISKENFLKAIGLKQSFKDKFKGLFNLRGD